MEPSIDLMTSASEGEVWVPLVNTDRDKPKPSMSCHVVRNAALKGRVTVPHNVMFFMKYSHYLSLTSLYIHRVLLSHTKYSS